MSQHSRYVISQVNIGQDTTTNPSLVDIQNHLTSTEHFQRNKLRYHFNITSHYSSAFVGALEFYKDDSVDTIETTSKSKSSTPVSNMVKDSQRFLCLSNDNFVLFAHRYRNKQDCLKFRECFTSAFNSQPRIYTLVARQPEPIFRQMSRLESIAKLVINLKSNEAKNDAITFMSQIQGDFFNQFTSSQTFEQNFEKKEWMEEFADRETSLLTFARYYTAWLSQNKHNDELQHLAEYINSSSCTVKLRRIELAALLASTSNNFRCRLYGHRSNERTLEYLIDFESVRNGETMFDVNAHKDLSDDEFRLNITNSSGILQS